MKNALRAGGKRAAGRDGVEHDEVPRHRAAALRAAARSITAPRSSCCTTCIIASRRSKPRGSARDLEPYPALLARRRDARGEPARLRADPQAYGDAARGRRGVQLDLGLQAPHREPAHRLHPHDHRARAAASRTCAASPISPRFTRCARASTAPRTFRRCAWARRFTSIPGCRTSASRNTCITRRRPTRSSRTTTRFSDGRLFCGESPGPRRRHRREARRALSVCAEAVADCASRRRLDVGLVTVDLERAGRQAGCDRRACRRGCRPSNSARAWRCAPVRHFEPARRSPSPTRRRSGRCRRRAAELEADRPCARRTRRARPATSSNDTTIVVCPRAVAADRRGPGRRERASP